jgi:hypothetical protein
MKSLLSFSLKQESMQGHLRQAAVVVVVVAAAEVVVHVRVEHSVRLHDGTTGEVEGVIHAEPVGEARYSLDKTCVDVRVVGAALFEFLRRHQVELARDAVHLQLLLLPLRYADGA